jgi:hypothetical protein
MTTQARTCTGRTLFKLNTIGYYFVLDDANQDSSAQINDMCPTAADDGKQHRNWDMGDLDR